MLVLLQSGVEAKASYTSQGIFWSTLAGAAGAFGALGIIMAFNFGGKPSYVMPLVFGCAPVVNAFLTIYRSGTYRQISPMFLAGLVLVAIGAAMVLRFTPSGTGHAAAPAPASATAAATVPLAAGRQSFQPDPPGGDRPSEDRVF